MKVKKMMLLLLSFTIILSNSLISSVFAADSSDSYISIELDKTTAKVGDIVKATVKVNNLQNIAGFQVNIKYDPTVLRAVNPDTQEDFKAATVPTGGDILVNDEFSVLKAAANDIGEGLINFGRSYMLLEDYRNSGKGEASGTLGIIGFKVLKEAETHIKFIDVHSMPGAVIGTLVFNRDNTNIPIKDYSVIQPPVINEGVGVVSPSPVVSGVVPSAVNPSVIPPVNSSDASPVVTPTPTAVASYTPVKTTTEPVTPLPGSGFANLAVSVSSDKTIYKEQQTIVYTIKYISKLESAEDIIVTAEIPQFTAIDNNGGGTVKDNTIQWSIKDVKPGVVGEIQYSVKVVELDKAEVKVVNNVSVMKADGTQGGNNSRSSISVLLSSDRFDKAFHKAYVSGYEGNLFKPENQITRAEIAAMFARILNLDVSKGDKQLYSDVPLTHWAAGYIKAVSEKGLFKGVADNKFNPNGILTRAELATAIFRYLQLNENVEPFEKHFTDVEKHWAFKYIEEVYRLKLINGYKNNVFLPNNMVKRAEAVTMLNKMLFRGPVSGAVSSFKDVPQNHWAVGQIEEAVKDHEYSRNLNGEEVLQ
jgi:hypothetical protein